MPKVTKIEATSSNRSLNSTLINRRKVCAYARVSTDSDEQFTSYEAQIDYYRKLILAKPEWEYVDVYADEGISGTNTKNREGFNRMIQDALNGKIDLIVTKSVSRFARNTVDTLSTIRKLKEKGVEVYFEKENIYTMNGSGELLITIMSSLAQEESRSLSENVKWGQRKSFSDGKVHLPYSRFLGYRKGENGKPEIVPEEAETVRLIYSKFMEGASISAIASFLNEKGIKTPGGKNKWRFSTIISILKNEKYKGDALLQKGYVENFLTHKTIKNNGEVPQYYVEGSHPAIVSPEEWDLVQLEFKRRDKFKRSFSGNGIFSNRIVCSDCGSFFGPKVWHSTDKYRTVIWQCNSKFHKSHEKCSTPHLTEEQIKEAFLKAYNELGKKKANVVEDCEFMIKLIDNTAELSEKIDSLNEEIDVVVGMVEKLIKENMAAPQDQDEFTRKHKSLEKRHSTLVEKVTGLEAERERKLTQINALTAYLEAYKKQPDFVAEWDPAIWVMTVEQVLVGREGRMRFKFYTGAEIEVTL